MEDYGMPPTYGGEKQKTLKDEIRDGVSLCDNLVAILRKALRDDPRDVSEELGNFITGFDVLEISSSTFLQNKGEKDKRKFPVYEKDGAMVEWTVPEIVSHAQDYIDGKNLGLEKIMSDASVDELARQYIKNLVLCTWGMTLYRVYKQALVYHDLYQDV